MNDNLSMPDFIDQCPYDLPQMALGRYYLVTICGTAFALISLIENTFIFLLLVSRRKYRHSHFLYWIYLVACDSTLSAIYIPLVSLDRLKDFYQNLYLTRLWWRYFATLLMMAHILKTWACYLILAATVERFVVTSSNCSKQWGRRIRSNRNAIVAASMVLTLIMKAPVFFEVELYHEPNCTGLLEFQPILSAITQSYLYGTTYRFYLRNMVTVFVPFALLAYFNARIVISLRKKERRAGLFRLSTTTRHHRFKVKSATRMLVLVVCTYLGSNILNVFLTAWEHIDPDSLYFSHKAMYSYCADLVSILSVLGCALRVPIYLAYSQDMRDATRGILLNCNAELYDKRTRIASTRRLHRAGTEFDHIATVIATQFPKREYNQQ